MPPIRPVTGPWFGPPPAGGRWPGHPRRRHRRGWLALRFIPFPLLVIAGLSAVSFLMAAIVMVAGIAFVVGAVVLPVLIVRGVRRSIRDGQRHRHQLSRPYGPALPAPPRRPPVDQWRLAKDRFTALRAEYAAYECDALAVLRLPALADVGVPSTARFVEAFAEAQALDVDGTPPQPHRERFVAAVELACRSWQAAREAAERIRLSHLPEEERSTVERVVRLLTKARDTDSDAERLVAYGKARSELARLERTGRIRLPRPAQAQLDNAYRAQLPR
jgi:hypothetical protein